MSWHLVQHLRINDCNAGRTIDPSRSMLDRLNSSLSSAFN